MRRHPPASGGGRRERPAPQGVGESSTAAVGPAEGSPQDPRQRGGDKGTLQEHRQPLDLREQLGAGVLQVEAVLVQLG
jgi:hypothetical protein